MVSLECVYSGLIQILQTVPGGVRVKSREGVGYNQEGGKGIYDRFIHQTV